MSRAVADLRAARALIADPAGWTTGAHARDARGRKVLPENAAAVCWCARGALFKATPTFDVPGIVFLARAAQELFDLPEPAVNDRLGHDAVLQIFDRAIELAEAAS